MNPLAQEFIDFLDESIETDYGDFKRRADLHLRRLIEALQTLSPDEIHDLRKVREELLWSPEEDPDINKVKKDLRSVVEHLR